MDHHTKLLLALSDVLRVSYPHLDELHHAVAKHHEHEHHSEAATDAAAEAAAVGAVSSL